MPRLSTAPLIEIRDLSVRRGRAPILDDISLEVHPGTLHALLGPNGAGKTTLVQSLLGGMPHRGSIRYHFRKQQNIGYVPQRLELDPTLPIRVQDFFRLMMQRRAVPLGSSAVARTQMRRLLALTGTEHLEGRSMATLSGGELQRILLAQALHPDPEVLILDEPTSSIDESGRQAYGDLLSRLRDAHQVTIFMVSHHLRWVLELADEVSVLDRRLIQSGSPAEIAKSNAIEQVFGLAPQPTASRGGSGRAGVSTWI